MSNYQEAYRDHRAEAMQRFNERREREEELKRVFGEPQPSYKAIRLEDGSWMLHEYIGKHMNDMRFKEDGIPATEEQVRENVSTGHIMSHWSYDGKLLQYNNSEKTYEPHPTISRVPQLKIREDGTEYYDVVNYRVM